VSPNNRKAAQGQISLGTLIAIAIVIGIFIAVIAMLTSNQRAAQLASVEPTPLPMQGDIDPSQIEPVAPETTGEMPPMTIDTSKTYIATIITPRGDIVIKLRPDLAPQTVNSFVHLANSGFYNGLTWHRVIAGFMAQGGDPTGTGTGDAGYNIPAEFTDKVSFDRPGIVAMARPSDDINGNSSQFFITTAPAPHLDGQYTIFGEVIEGQDIADGIPLRDPNTATTPGEQMLQILIAEQ
jgi:peptidylprolyl isomerase